MKVKNLWISFFQRKNINKLVIVRERSLPIKIIKFIIETNNNEYRCVFTDKRYYIRDEDVIPLSLALDPEQMKRNISKKELLKFYKENKENLISLLTKEKKEIIGFHHIKK